MAAMETLLPIYGVICLVALVTGAVLMMCGEERWGCESVQISNSFL